MSDRNPDESSDALVEALSQTPTDDALRLRAARALQREGRGAEAVGVLLAGHWNVTRHGKAADSPAPCLCKRCLRPEVDSVEMGGMPLVRDFTVAYGRVLFFWVPASLAGQADAVRDAVTDAMLGRLKPLKPKQPPKPRKAAAADDDEEDEDEDDEFEDDEDDDDEDA